MRRVRVDDELISQGLAADRDEALRLCMAGLVSCGGERLESPAARIEPGAPIHVKGRIPYVGRGGLKLAGALDAFGVDPTGLTCIDIGCSTGGFTDCLLQRGAARVVAVDVGRAQFAWSLRRDPRVTLLERTNIVDVPAQGFSGAFDLAVCDVSFTGIGVILPAVMELLGGRGRYLTLVKPQFEAAPDEVGAGGVVRDPAVHARVLEHAIALFAEAGLYPVDLCASPITGAKGNREFFLLGDRELAGREGPEALGSQVERLVERSKTL